MSGEPVIVLLVEDNEDHAELVKRQLADHRIVNTLIHLTDGQQALDYLCHLGNYQNPLSSPRPHVIFLDLRLPKVDGIEILKILKDSDEFRSIPIVILTTSDAERDVGEAYNRHANSYIVKPVDYEKFRQLMNDLGFYWMSWNTCPPK